MSRYVLAPSHDGIAIFVRAPGVPPRPLDAAEIALLQGRHDARAGVYRPQIAPSLLQRQMYDRGWQDGRRVPNVAVGPTLLALTASGAWPPTPVAMPQRRRNPSRFSVTTISLAPPGFRA